MMTTFYILLLAAYLLGTIPFGLLLARFAGLGDIRTIGSGNIGATNVLRTGNKKIAALTLLLDGLKAFAAVKLTNIILLPQLLAANAYTDCLPGPCYSEASVITYSAFAGLAAIIGHIFPIWLKFKGGKGVASTVGVALALSPWLGLAVAGSWIAMAALFRYSSLSALIAIALLPLYAYALIGNDAVISCCALIALLVIGMHHQNIKRLLAGTEPQIGRKKKP